MTPSSWTLTVEERTERHWVAWAGDLVIVLVLEGSHDDVGHVAAAARVVARLHRKLETPLRLLFVVPPMLSKAPSPEVRAAILADARRLEAAIDRAALVVLGAGFGPALHRSAATGVLALLRLRMRWKIHASLAEALAFLLGSDHAALSALTVRCEEEARARR